MSFFEELKRRNVVKVGLAYLVGSWLLIQVDFDSKKRKDQQGVSWSFHRSSPQGERRASIRKWHKGEHHFRFCRPYRVKSKKSSNK